LWDWINVEDEGSCVEDLVYFQDKIKAMAVADTFDDYRCDDSASILTAVVTMESLKGTIKNAA